MGAQLGGKGGFSELNLTPLIDIVLVVLIIMMVSMPIQIEEMGVKVPGKQDVPPPPPDVPVEQLVIALYPDNTIALNRKLMTQDMMFFEVTRRLRPMENKAVFIDAETTVPFTRVVDMMDLAREAGAAKVGLAKIKEGGPQVPTSVASGAAPRGMTIGSPVVLGIMDQTKADEAVQPFKGNYEKCYLDALATSKDLNGRVLLLVGVGPQGEILDHKIGSTTLEGGDEATTATFLTCLDNIAPSLKFAPLGAQNTARVQYPMLFSPG